MGRKPTEIQTHKTQDNIHDKIIIHWKLTGHRRRETKSGYKDFVKRRNVSEEREVGWMTERTKVRNA